jgi:hypothetical protein
MAVLEFFQRGAALRIAMRNYWNSASNWGGRPKRINRAVHFQLLSRNGLWPFFAQTIKGNFRGSTARTKVMANAQQSQTGRPVISMLCASFMYKR